MTSVADKRHPAETSSPGATSSAEPPRQILLVEDHEPAGHHLARLLSKDPRLKVTLVSDGEAALQALEENAFSLMITDLRLPQLDGMDLIRAINEK
jgi:DNA-binding response OmpR family regulator